MRDDLPTRSRFAAVVSFTSFLLALACLAFLAWFVPADRRGYFKLFGDLKMELPGITKLMLSIPDFVFPVAAVGTALVAIAIQWSLRSKVGAALFHMFVVVFCCLTFVAYREAVFQPLSSLIRTLSNSP